MSLARTITLASFALTTAASALAAQISSGLSAADTKEIAAYSLTMDAMRKYEAAMRAFGNEMKKDPRVQKGMKLQAELDALEKKDEPTDADMEKMESLKAQIEKIKEEMDGDGAGNLLNAKSLAEMAAQTTKIPKFAAALKSAGMTPREYSVFTMALFQASMYAALKKSGTLKPSDIPKHINPAHIKFIEEHEADLKAMQERFAKESGSQ